MWLAIDKAWNIRMNVPGMSKGMFAHRTAGELLFTGYKDVLLYFQGTQFVRRLVDGFEGQVQGLVPPVINDNNVSNPAGYGGNPILTSYYDAQGNIITNEEGINITQYPYPRTFATGVHDPDVTGVFK